MPNGDFGGNEIKVSISASIDDLNYKPDSDNPFKLVNNLHSVWDSIMGQFTGYNPTRSEITQWSSTIQQKYPRSSIDIGDIDEPKTWVDDMQSFAATVYKP